MIRVALVQMCSGRDIGRNTASAVSSIREAKAAGAAFVTTPEMTNIMEPDRQRLRALACPESEDPSVATFSEMAASLGLWLNIGSLALKGPGGALVNRSLLFSPDGRIVARYDKIHLFDVELPSGESLRESEAYAPGATAVLAQTELGRLGLTICYDLRFPGLFRALAQAGATLFTVPSAFTVPTGAAHWHVLLRARSIETGSFMLAAAQAGTHESGRQTYGHSIVISPWGEVLAEAGTEACVTLAEIDPAEAARARSRIPSLLQENAREFVVLKPTPGIAS